jgi:pilus assembly protein Flp/PilA
MPGALKGTMGLQSRSTVIDPVRWSPRGLMSRSSISFREHQMASLVRTIARARQGEEGASAVEYGLLVAAIAAVIVIIALGGVIQNIFSNTCSAVSSGASVAGQNCAG